MRFNIILTVVALILGYATCKSFQKTAETPANSGIVAEGNQQTLDQPLGMKVAHVLGSNPDSAPPVEIHQPPARVNVPLERLAPANTSRRAYLSTGWWHCSMAFVGNDSLVHKAYQDKWLRFHEDQTFEVLIKGKKVDSGKWGWDEENNQIYLSCQDTYINNTWQIQDKGFVMVWKGNTDVNVTGIQVRVVCHKTEPQW